MPSGRIRFYNEKEGYGFIQREVGADVFLHTRDVQEGPVAEHDYVKFNIVSSERGPRAENITVIEQENDWLEKHHKR